MSTTSRIPRDQVVALRPGDVKAYLIGRGWVIEPDGPTTKALAFREPRTGAEVLLPMDRELGDFVLRMADIVTAVAQVEGRPWTEVVNDLSTPPGDLLRLRVVGSAASLGQLPLDDGIKLLQGGRELLWSSAFSLQRPDALLSRNKSKEVDAFLRSCRLGQTERGSFVATILAPVPPLLQARLDFGETHLGDEPFARRVTSRLMSSLGVVSDAIRSGNSNEILQGVPRGVSANLCEALATMEPPGDDSQLDLEVTWARSRPNMAPTVPRSLHFPKEDFPVLQEAARRLRDRASARRERYEGEIVNVHRVTNSAHPGVVGRMVLATQVGHRVCRVKVDLGPEDFGAACEALRDGKKASATGIIRSDVKGHEYVLSEPDAIEVVEPE